MSSNMIGDQLALPVKSRKFTAVVDDRGTAGGEEQREKWGSKLDFILSCVGYAVGLGNVLRFPYLAGRNGGAAFLIPYVIMMVLCGLPGFFMELALGQYGQVSPMFLYRRLAPFFTGIGYTMVTISLFTGIYYNLYLAWTFRYLYDTILSVFGETLPWDSCPTFDSVAENELYYDTCQNDKICPSDVLPSWTNYTIFRNVCYNSTEFNKQMKNSSFSDAFTSANDTGFDTAATTYFNVLFGYNKTAEIFEEWGWPKLDIAFALVFSWVLVFVILAKGIKASGKVTYFTVTFPYLLLLILLVLGLTLDGSELGIQFYMSPKWEKLLDYTIWSDAASQIFFSLSVGGGGLTTLATYNKFSNNIFRHYFFVTNNPIIDLRRLISSDTIIVVVGNCATSFFVGFVVFPIIGFISKRTGTPVEKLALAGPALAYTSYPDAIAHFPQPAIGKVLGIAFFFMMILLAIDSEMVIVEVPITALEDSFPALKKNAWTKAFGVFLVCFVSFLIGLILTTKSGPPLQNVMDTAAGGWTLLISVLFEMIVVSYVYGIGRFVADLRMMLGRPPNTFWKVLGYPVNPFWTICWFAVTPLLLVVVLVLLFLDMAKGNFLKYDGRDYPDWGVGLGIGLTAIVVMWIPLFMILSVCQAVFFKKGWAWLFTAGDEWGPLDRSLRERIAREHPYRYRMPYNVVQPTPFSTYTNQELNSTSDADDFEMTARVNPSAPPSYYEIHNHATVRPMSYIINDE